MTDEERCLRCRGNCCFVVKADGFLRYAFVRPHGQGGHWCDCENGYVDTRAKAPTQEEDR